MSCFLFAKHCCQDAVGILIMNKHCEGVPPVHIFPRCEGYMLLKSLKFQYNFFFFFLWLKAGYPEELVPYLLDYKPGRLFV